MINPPPSHIELFNFQWKKWLNSLYEDVTDIKTWTVTVSDSSGNDATPTATGYYMRTGNMVTASTDNIGNIDTTGLTAGDEIRINLPVTSHATYGRACGSIILDNFAYGTGRTESCVLSNLGLDYMNIRAYGSASDDRNFIVSDITSTTSDIVRLSITYFV